MPKIFQVVIDIQPNYWMQNRILVNKVSEELTRNKMYFFFLIPSAVLISLFYFSLLRVIQTQMYVRLILLPSPGILAHPWYHRMLSS